MKLYMAHVGFYEETNGIYEIHSNIFVAAEDLLSAKMKIKNQPLFIEKNMHIDGIQEIVCVDGYDVLLTQQTSEKSNAIFHYDEIKQLT